MRGVQTSLAKAAGLLLVTWGGAAAAPTQVFDYGRFGEISMYRGDTAPRDVVLFLSGDGGWNLGVISMARGLDKGRPTHASGCLLFLASCGWGHVDPSVSAPISISRNQFARGRESRRRRAAMARAR